MLSLVDKHPTAQQIKRRRPQTDLWLSKCSGRSTFPPSSMSPLPSSPPPGPLTNSASTEPNPAGFSFGSRPGVISEDKFTHERKPSPSRQSSFIFQPSKSKRQGSSNLSANGTETSNLVIATSQDSPVLVDFVHSRAANADWRDAQVITQSPASRDSLSKMLSRTATTPVNGYNAVALPAGSALTSTLASESAIIYGHIHETANKRISTLDYLRKAYVSRTLRNCAAGPHVLLQISLAYDIRWNVLLTAHTHTHTHTHGRTATKDASTGSTLSCSPKLISPAWHPLLRPRSLAAPRTTSSWACPSPPS